jgi:hypothetical protein
VNDSIENCAYGAIKITKKEECFMRTSKSTRGRRKRKSVIIYGNCVAEAIGSILQENPHFTKQYDIVFSKPVYLMTELDSKAVLELAKTADLIIHQPISGFNPTSDTLLSIARNAKTISYPVPYFDGYFPDITYLRDADGQKILHEPIDYHSKIILAAFDSKWDVISTARLFTQNELFKPEFILRNVDNGLAELARRESTLDVKITDFIKKYYTKRQLFYSMNHPTAELLFFMIDSILNILGLPQSNAISKDKFSHVFDAIQWPITASIAKILGLEFSAKVALGGPLSIEKFVEKYYEFYLANPDVVKVNLHVVKDVKSPSTSSEVLIVRWSDLKSYTSTENNIEGDELMD